MKKSLLPLVVAVIVSALVESRSASADDSVPFFQVRASTGVMAGVGSTWGGGLELGAELPLTSGTNLTLMLGIIGGNKLRDAELAPTGHYIATPVSVLVGPRWRLVRIAAGGGVSPLVLQIPTGPELGFLSPFVAGNAGVGSDGCGLFLVGRAYAHWCTRSRVSPCVPCRTV